MYNLSWNTVHGWEITWGEKIQGFTCLKWKKRESELKTIKVCIREKSLQSMNIFMQCKTWYVIFLPFTFSFLSIHLFTLSHSPIHSFTFPHIPVPTHNRERVGREESVPRETSHDGERDETSDGSNTPQQKANFRHLVFNDSHHEQW